jgi:ABC-2 type transport system ATP-binding protein
MSAMIDVAGLSKSYGRKRGITDVTFQVQPGEVFGFLGPNGAGKTTTIRTLMALLRADSGSARIGGFDCWDQSVEVKRITGYLPGEPALDGGLTGGQILEYFANLRGGVDQTYLKSLVERLGLDPTRKFHQYSSGNKRKVVLIQAFMHRPPLLILDEPTNGLDPLNQQEFERMVREVQADGRTVFLSSHILSEVEQICTRVAIIREGQLVRVGDLAQLKDIKRSELTLVFAGPVSTDSFAGLSGVSSVASSPDGRTLHLELQGGADDVIKAAAAHPVISISSHEPSLEDIFLRYYTDDGAAPASSTPDTGSSQSEVKHVV